MSYVSKLNKKDILLKESNNKMLYVSEVIKKKGLEIFFFLFNYILVKITISDEI